MTEPDWNHRYFDANGIRIHYIRHGAGKPLVLLHGWPEFWRTWCKNILPLAEPLGKGRSDPDHLNENWYRAFHQLPWAADLIGHSRETCRLYIGHFLSHWAGRADAFNSEDIEAWVDNFMKPCNLQGGFNWCIGYNAAHLALLRGGPPRRRPGKRSRGRRGCCGAKGIG